MVRQDKEVSLASPDEGNSSSRKRCMEFVEQACQKSKFVDIPDRNCSV